MGFLSIKYGKGKNKEKVKKIKIVTDILLWVLFLYLVTTCKNEYNAGYMQCMETCDAVKEASGIWKPDMANLSNFENITENLTEYIPNIPSEPPS